MNEYKKMRREAPAFAFIAGLSAGIISLLCALNALVNALAALVYVAVPIGLILAAGALVAVAAVNFAGGCVCRKNRVAGGVMMLFSAVLLLLFGGVCIYVGLTMPGLFEAAVSADFAEGVQRAVLGAGILLIFVELLSGAAGVVSVAVKAKPDTGVARQDEQPKQGEEP